MRRLVLLLVPVPVILGACVTADDATTVPATAATTSAVVPSTLPPDVETLTVGTSLPLTSLDSADAYLAHDWEVLGNIGQGLMGFASGTTDVVSGLAESVDISNDGHTYVFRLRDDVAFGDGTALTAALYERHIERLLALDGTAGAALADPFVESIQATDDHTVAFRLFQPAGFFQALVAGVPYHPTHPGFPIDEVDQFPDAPVLGVGRWLVTEYEVEERTVLEPNPFAGGETPFFGRIVIRYFSSEADAFDALAAATVDVVWPVTAPPSVDLPTDVVGFPSGGGPMRVLVLNHGIAPTDSADVRRALAAAIDREALVGELPALSEPLYSPIPPGFLGATTPFAAATGSSVELLTSAGFSTRNPLEMAIDYPSDRYGEATAAAANTLADQWEATGLVDVELRSAPWDVYVSQLLGGETYAAALLGWRADYFDPHPFVEPFVVLGGLGTNVTDPDTGQPTASLSRPELVRLVEQAAAEVDSARRKELYGEIQDLWADDVVTIPLWWEPAWVYYREGLVADPDAPYAEALNIGPTLFLDYAALARR